AVNDTIWVANRLAGVSAIRGFDAATGDVVRTVPLTPNSQPGDLAYAKGKLYVADELRNPHAAPRANPPAGADRRRRDGRDSQADFLSQRAPLHSEHWMEATSRARECRW